MTIRTPDAPVFRFGVFELDTHSGELRRHGLKVRLPEHQYAPFKTIASEPAYQAVIRQVGR